MVNLTNKLVDHNVIKIAFTPRVNDTKVICYYLDVNKVAPAEKWMVELCGCQDIEAQKPQNITNI